MRVLEYDGLDTARVSRAYARVKAALEASDFKAAQVRKRTGVGHGRYCRARLDDADRLLFTLVRHGEQTCVLAGVQA